MSRLTRIRDLCDVALRLGLQNVFWVALHRLTLKSGFYRWRYPVGHELPALGFFETDHSPESSVTVRYFGCHAVDVSSPPEWLLNPWTGRRLQASKRHWSEIADFSPEAGDIKVLWELSRFDWLVKDAWRYKCNGLTGGRIECWLRDWARCNPINTGLNWKCGQETSMRAMNLLVASLCVEDQFDRPGAPFLQWLNEHARRIAATVRYAMAQDNNHGTSEAAALFVLGAYLQRNGGAASRRRASGWHKMGRRWLENRARKLIMSDGTFSQYSVTYHRLMLDTLSFAELMRRRLELAPLSTHFYDKAVLATQWLSCLIEPTRGNAPNLGANDGAYLFNLEDGAYRDFRPSVQLGMEVFLRSRVFDTVGRHPLIQLLGGLEQEMVSIDPPESALFPAGGMAVMRHHNWLALLRLPVFQFRPSQSDALHFDLWLGTTNLIRDAGTYSYNARLSGRDSQSYLAATESHSTVQFDGRDQMPRIGRFLYGRWLRPLAIEHQPGFGTVESAYRDYCGARHRRKVRFMDGAWEIHDDFSDFTVSAALRWRLAPGEWCLSNNVLTGELVRLRIESSLSVSISLEASDESLCYLAATKIPVLVVRTTTPGSIVSIIEKVRKISTAPG